MRSVILLFLTVALASTSYAGEGLKLSAKAEPDRLPPGAELRLVITVEGKGAADTPEPSLPRLKNFEIVGKSTSQRYSIVNLETKVTKTTVYRLRAPREGKFEIPPVTLEADGKTYKSDPVEVVVDPGAPAPKGPSTARRGPGSIFPDFGGFFRRDPFPHRTMKLEKDDLFATMEVDKTEVVPFEMITATFSFYRAVDIWDKPGYQKPDFEGFWVEQLPFPGGEKEKTVVEEVDGKTYHVNRMRYALFPISEGEKLVDSAVVSAQVDPWSDRVERATAPILVNVRPFPRGAPEAFDNMVGRFETESDLGAESIRVNDGATLKITVSGEGYLKPAPAPAPPAADGLDIFDPKIADTVDKSGGVILSKRVIEYPIVAREQGTRTIPPTTFAWYDPEAGRYVTRRTEPLDVKVLPAGDTPSAGDHGAAPDHVKAAEGLFDIKPDRTALPDWSAPPHRRWGLWLIAVVIPAAVIGAAWAVARRRDGLLKDPVRARRSSAATRARRALAEAERVENTREFFAALDVAARSYLADKWNMSAPSITKDIVKGRIAENGDGLRDLVTEFFDMVERARYAPSMDGDKEEGLRAARRIIDRMEAVE
ncbi:MAG: BatD family protein [Candidatus Nitrospinota bacterium M3_3B_026]